MPSFLRTLVNSIGINPVGWIRNTARMRAMVSDFDAQPTGAANGNAHFLVVITPWLGTSVPWYTLALGLLLAKNGNKISFVIDDFPFGNSNLRYRFVLGCLRSVMRRLRHQYEVIDLSSLKVNQTLEAAAKATVTRLARLNAVWQLKGEMLEAGRKKYTARCIDQLSAAYNPIASILRPGAFDVVLIPGGVYSTSGIWAEVARAAGIRIASFDGGSYGTVMIATNGIACHLQDIPVAFSTLKSRCANPAERAFVLGAAQAEMERRRAGVDTFASQVKGSDGGDDRYNGAVLLALNSSWDAAALGLQAVFKDNSQWIVETTRYLLAHTTAPVIVRQHPAERLNIARTSDDYRLLLQKNFGSEPRLHFIAADETINSYALLDRVAVVVAYTSTIGIEAAALGKPVITASNSYYSNLGFVWKASALDQYNSLLSKGAKSLLRVTSEMREDAYICFYITQCCNWVFTSFNPAEFSLWSAKGLTSLRSDITVQMICESLRDNVPISILTHSGFICNRGAIFI